MQFTVEGRQEEIKVTSVVLESDITSPRTLRFFHCTNCGRFMFKYMGSIQQIFPGETGETPIKLSTIIGCHSCKEKFFITSIA